MLSQPMLDFTFGDILHSPKISKSPPSEALESGLPVAGYATTGISYKENNPSICYTRGVIMTAMRIHRFWRLFVLAACGLIIGCASVPFHPPWISKIDVLTEPIGPEEILKLPEGEKISFQHLLAELPANGVVFVGESHNQIEHHQIQTNLLKELLKREKNPVIAMEMFERSKQPILDRGSQGQLTEEEFLKEVQWDTFWGFDYSLYKPILDEVKEHRLKVLGLNTQRELVRR